MMTKLEYLKQLEDALKNRMSRKDIDDIIRDYAEYFAEGQRQGKSEFETARGLGTPQEVAEQIVSEGMGNTQSAINAKVKNTWKKVRTSSIWNKVFLVILILALSPFILAGGGLILAALGIVVSILASTPVGATIVTANAIAYLAFGLIGRASFAVAVCGVMGIGLMSPSIVALSLIVAVGMLAGSVLGICLACMAIRSLWRLLKNLLRPRPRYKPINPHIEEESEEE